MRRFGQSKKPSLDDARYPGNTNTLSVLFSVVVVLGLTACATDFTRQELAQEYYNLGNAFYELGRYEQSYEYYERALAMSPDLPAASYNLARLHIDRGDFPEAAAILTGLLSDDPTNLLVRESLGYTWYKAGDLRKSLDIFLALAEDYPGRAQVAYNLARIAGELGVSEMALPHLQEAVSMYPDDGGLLWELSGALFASGFQDEALGTLERYGILVSTDVEKCITLAERYFLWEYYLPAIETFTGILEFGELSPLSTIHLSISYLLATNEFQTGLQILKSVLEENLTTGELPELLAELEKLTERLPDDDAALVLSTIDEATTAAEINPEEPI